jgi:hypothetical protein
VKRKIKLEKKALCPPLLSSSSTIVSAPGKEFEYFCSFPHWIGEHPKTNSPKRIETRMLMFDDPSIHPESKNV